MKINLDTKIKDNRGNDVFDEIVNEKGEKKAVQRTLREDFLRILGQQYDRNILKDPKEYTWVYALSVVCNGKENEVEIEDEKVEFLRKLIRNNKFIYYTRTQQGLTQLEASIFTPFEAGQLLSILEEKK